MKKHLLFLLPGIGLTTCTSLFAQDPVGGESTQYVLVTSSNPDAVVLDGTDFFESEAVGVLLQHQPVTVLDSTDGEYVMIRAVIGGKTVEGWVKKRILGPKPKQNIPSVNESGAVENASIGAPGTVTPGIPEMDSLWQDIDLTGKDAKILPTPIIPVKPSSPVVPILASAASIGGLVYFITNNEAEPCNFTATANATQPTCGNANGSISISTMPVTSYTYAWAHGAVDNTLTALPPGQYIVTVTQTNTSCVQTLTVTLTDATSFNTSVTAQPADCGIANGSATVNVNPPGNYTFVWSNGSTQQNQTDLAAGSYTVTVTKDGNCSQTHDVTVSSLAFEASISIVTTPSDCGLSTGSASASVDPPGEYNYAWSNGQSGPTATALAAGNYSVTVSIAGTSCSKEASVTVVDTTAIFITGITSQPASCGVTDGAAQVSTVGPATLYSFIWSGGQQGSEVQTLSPGMHTVTVTLEGTSCSETGTVTIEELPPNFTLSSTVTPASCGQSDGSAMVIAMPSGVYQYRWSIPSATDQINLVPGGEYMVTVTIPGTMCSQSLSITVPELPPAFTVTSTVTPADCGQSNGTASVNVDPPGEYTYMWSGGQQTSSVSDLAAGTYSVTVSAGDTSCQAEAIVEIPQVPIDVTSYVSSTPAGCGTANGTATVDSVTGADGFTISIAWSNGQTTPTATSLLPGEYVVTITLQAPGCFSEITDTVLVEQVKSNFTASISTTPADCGIANGSATAVVDPPGTYTYLWSNDANTSSIQNVSGGTYQLTITDSNSCTASFELTIPDQPSEYIEVIQTVPATCIGGGEITISLTTNAAGPLVLQITHPGGNIELALNAGTHNLSDHITILPGAYVFNVYDQSVGNQCTEMTQAVIDDQTPPLQPVDDVYATEVNQGVTGNVLTNDGGLQLIMTGVQTVIGGMVTFLPDGSFVFTPSNGFEGTASFEYTMQDACGTAGTATVTITVASVDCDFTIQSEITTANCGIANGAIAVEVNEAGNYSYLWDTGDTGNTLGNVAAGTYALTITDEDLGCFLEFEFTIDEYPAEYVSNVVVIQPTCTSPGEIQFELNTQGDIDFLNVAITHPNGADNFLIEPGLVRLSDYVDITPGSYDVEVYIGNAGPDCIETFSAEIEMAPGITIFEEAVFPPSSPSAMDGGAIIIVSPPGVAPYQVLLNGIPYATSQTETIQILGLGVGTYTVQVIDNAGCESNELVIMVPFPDIILEFGMGILHVPADASNPEHVAAEGFLTNSTWMTVDYDIGPVPQRVRLTYIAPVYGSRYHTTSLFQGDYSFPLEWKPSDRIAFEASAGMSFHNFYQHWKTNASLMADVKWQAGKKMSVHGVVRTLINERAPLVLWCVNFAMPF